MKSYRIRSSIALLTSRFHRQEFSSKAFLLEKATIRKDLPDSTRRYYKKVPLFNFQSLSGNSLYAARELSLWDRMFGNEGVAAEDVRSAREDTLYENLERELTLSASRRQRTIPIITKSSSSNSTNSESPTAKNHSSADLKQSQTPATESPTSTNLSDIPIDQFWEKQNQDFQAKVERSRPKEKVWTDNDPDPFVSKPSTFQEPSAYTDQLDDRQFEGSREISSSKSRFRNVFKRRSKSNDNTTTSSSSKDERKSNSSQRFESADQFPSTDQFWDSQNESFQHQIKSQRTSDPPTWNDDSKDPWKPDKSFSSPFTSDTLSSSSSSNDDRSSSETASKGSFDRILSSMKGKEGAAIAVAALVIGLVYMLTPHVKRWLQIRRNSRKVFQLTDRTVDLRHIPKHLQVYHLIPITATEAEKLPDQEVVVVMATNQKQGSEQ